MLVRAVLLDKKPEEVPTVRIYAPTATGYFLGHY
jgi:hypothetical protein